MTATGLAGLAVYCVGVTIFSTRSIAASAVFFGLGDARARDRFTRARFLSRAMGLSLYYAAQITLAITCGLIS